MRIVMMGTGPFAVPAFRAVLESGHEVPLLVTQPLRENRGRRAAAPSPMRQLAQERGVPIFDPASINTDEARAELASQRPELLVVADYGQILAPATLGIAPAGGINLHASLLPRYRGAAPVNWAIWHGDQETGVTVIHMTATLDAGPALAQARLALDPEETAPQLEQRLAELGAPLVTDTIERLERGDTRSLPQDAASATRARRLRKSDGALDWRRTAQQLKNQTRALEPWPRTYTHWLREEAPPLRLIPGHVALTERDRAATPGEILEAAGERLVVATSDAALALEGVQPEGKRMLSTAEFLRGYPVRVGQRFDTLQEP